ncbi:MAG: murein L,D-transpeptidase [Cereibacter sphaeroides]|uniref:Murein L,D-transpeptidase n=1 Tax=Cereibacter sphaeroides TaxID=1063 RepID=A0A2W5S8R3_CERSP|nr:MAG: murein L,D-transpeptidase [Cereibacter sphaeroides]
MTQTCRRPPMPLWLCATFLIISLIAPQVSLASEAQTTAFRQAVAEAAAEDEALAAFYRDNDYQAIWTDADDSARRGALLTALSHADDHALPVNRYDPDQLVGALRSAWSERDRGRIEVRMSRAFLDYARDVQTGALMPAKVDAGILREVPVRDRREQIAAFSKADPVAYLQALPPRTPEYALLMRERLLLQKRIADGGWGPTVSSKSLQPGDFGQAVVQLRDRLVAMGMMGQTASQDYDGPLIRAVQQFQYLHGLATDGVAGADTVQEINVSPEQRLKSVVVAMERERWMNIDRGDRYIWVNLPDFSTRIVDHGKITFQTRSVIGKNDPDRRTPEFSDQMEYMVVNPSWNVPRSITTKEYLPLLKSNPNAAGHLKIVDRNGRVVPRSQINFAAYTARNFPYSMRQPPSDGNALGKVKFMFPNVNNIYLHDTPQKELFTQPVRAYSHGCIRLNDPFDFAYALLAVQSDDPQGLFSQHLKTDVETVIKLDVPVPVHLVYFTAYPTAKGQMTYRRDVYGRDARIFEALTEAGVALEPVQG